MPAGEIIQQEAAFEIVRPYIEEWLSGKKTALAFDFDRTLSRNGQSQGQNPKDSFVDHLALDSLKRLRSKGMPIVIISGRSGRKIAELFQIPKLYIVGTLGWETFTTYKDRPTEDLSSISDKFTPYQCDITRVLKEVRFRLFNDFNISPDLNDEIELELPTNSGGVIYLERSGVNPLYPEGIMHTWNLNRVIPDERDIFVKKLQQYYQTILENLDSSDALYVTELQRRCGLIPPDKLAQEAGRYSAKIGPISQISKVHAIIQLLRNPNSPQKKRDSCFNNIPFGFDTIIYAGDHPIQDGKVFEAGRKASLLTRGQKRLFSIWVKHQDLVTSGAKISDITVEGVSGNASLLDQMATFVEKRIS